ncbi:hypothetical protein RHGRI_004961 [Rhododendron griersonianum]|uniref:Uncharacterized protein n=1 Tax=Rhododendron griersonianum TaxID=479676 RepID=A0AAV6LAJ5_9ERIC|nr:hypothetical protein RHGRI_004961 [Rhododendron griersonianum]
MNHAVQTTELNVGGSIPHVMRVMDIAIERRTKQTRATVAAATMANSSQSRIRIRTTPKMSTMTMTIITTPIESCGIGNLLYPVHLLISHEHRKKTLVPRPVLFLRPLLPSFRPYIHPVDVAAAPITNLNGVLVAIRRPGSETQKKIQTQLGREQGTQMMCCVVLRSATGAALISKVCCKI